MNDGPLVYFLVIIGCKVLVLGEIVGVWVWAWEFISLQIPSDAFQSMAAESTCIFKSGHQLSNVERVLIQYNLGCIT
jgi:hypothetical protein